MYLAVDPLTKEIVLTFNKSRADLFSVMTVNETLHHHELEFSLTSSLSNCKERRESIGIGSMTLTEHDDGTDQPQHDKVVPLEYMLEVVVNPITGRGGSAPKMKLSTNYRRTRLLLQKRSDRRISCNTKDWIKGTEAYYIQCLHPLMKGFLCVKERNTYRRQNQGSRSLALVEEVDLKDRYKVCVKGSAADESRFLTLFRLHPEQSAKQKPERPKMWKKKKEGMLKGDGRPQKPPALEGKSGTQPSEPPVLERESGTQPSEPPALEGKSGTQPVEPSKTLESGAEHP